MNFFTQEAVVCPHCHAVYALARFSRRELNRFGRQAQVHELAEEEKMLACVQTLFARYPKLLAVHARQPSNLAYRSVMPLEEWLYPLLPEASQWSFTNEEHEVLKYLSNHYVPSEASTQMRERRRKLVQKVAAERVRCRHCRQGALLLDAKRLNATYTRYLKALSNEGDYQKLMTVCLPFILVVSLLGVFGLNSQREILWQVCAVASLIGLACVCLLLYDSTANRTPRVFTEAANRNTGEGMERVFRGRYYQYDYVWYFAWKTGQDNYEVRCELFSIKEGNWDWFTKVIEKHEPLSRDFSAVFELEFCGVFVGTGRSGRAGSNYFLVEIQEILSARLVSASDGSTSSDELLRPAVGGPETPAEELVRPAEMQD